MSDNNSYESTTDFASSELIKELELLINNRKTCTVTMEPLEAYKFMTSTLIAFNHPEVKSRDIKLPDNLMKQFFEYFKDSPAITKALIDGENELNKK